MANKFRYFVMFWHGFTNRRDLIFGRNRDKEAERGAALPECLRPLYYLRFEAAVVEGISNRVL